MTLEEFACENPILKGKCEKPTASGYFGTTLRDWFAGLAMQALVTKAGTYNHEGLNRIPDRARTAYQMADEMLKVRGES